MVGLATGMLSGAFGVGGAVISTPGIRILGASAFEAVGTTLPAIIPSAAVGTARYAREGLVDWPIVGATAPVGAVTAVAASYASHAVPGEGHLLMVLTAAILGYTAWRMARNDEASAEDHEDGERATSGDRRSLPGAAGVGAVAGALSGLLGVGGGVVLVPGFSELLRLPLKTAIATSLACVGILAVPSTVAHTLLGDIDWRMALLLAVAVVPGSRLGAVLSIRATDRRLRLAVAGFLGAIAVAYGIGEISAALR
ncbi:MAG TPA: sulfite exporter TauE/SafE family protein [Acidimicrobiales bacterium]|nr:sulfite exporter TauE/SafE family protein [Acidimicrobiales bacterium]